MPTITPNDLENAGNDPKNGGFRNLSVNEMLSLSYPALFNYLQEKYGLPDGPFSLDGTGKYPNEAILKPNLVVHHFFSVDFDDISSKNGIDTHNYMLQQPEYLCYANLIEELILHVKIAVLNNNKKDKKTKMRFSYYRIYINLVPLLNDFYSGWKPSLETKSLFDGLPNKEEYLNVVKYMIENNIFNTFFFASANNDKNWDYSFNLELYSEIVDFSEKKITYSAQLIASNQYYLENNLIPPFIKKNPKPWFLKLYVIIPIVVIVAIAIVLGVMNKAL